MQSSDQGDAQRIAGRAGAAPSASTIPGPASGPRLVASQMPGNGRASDVYCPCGHAEVKAMIGDFA
jgi:hypothetical protein